MRFLVFFWLIFFCSWGAAKDLKVYKMTQVAEEVDRLLHVYTPGDILVLFDIDMTILEPSQDVLGIPGMKQYHMNK